MAPKRAAAGDSGHNNGGRRNNDSGAAAADDSDDDVSMVSSSRSRSSSTEEKVMDPKLAEAGDASDNEMAQPAKKRKVDHKKTEGPIRDGDNRKFGSERHDWNPKPGSLPEEKTPLQTLREEMDKQDKASSSSSSGNVIFLMAMKSLRIEDSRGLAHASEVAQKNGKNLIVFFFVSPGDWKMHDRSPRRIDFVLRNLREIRKQLQPLHIPLVVYTEKTRTKIPQTLISFAKEWNVSEIVANVEYEVDECWRDIAVLREASKAGIRATFVEDAYVVPAGEVKTKDGRQFSVFSPWNRAWTAHLTKNMHLLDESPAPSANSSKTSKDIAKLFDDEKLGKGYGLPEHAEGFECHDTDYMQKLWPAGSHAARTVLENFLRRKGGESGLKATAIGDEWKDVGANAKESRISRYGIGRNLMSENGTSRLSPYLAAGVLSPRACLRATVSLDNDKLRVGRSTGTEMWNTEISFRDFYAHVLAAWPRVSMDRAYVTKFEDVVWEYDEKTFSAWAEGRTGYPIVDAAMRQLNKSGWCHNRGRMIVAMFLSKHLMIDWRWGERYFAQNLIDSDLASNNAGWQWSASTGTDASPFFRLFNPESQSEKCDPRGEYLRYWLPELAGIEGAAIHAPHSRLAKKEFEKLGYPRPIVDHKWARERALRRFRDPGVN
ncbi:unnamed protein product [Parajaminaea phylloscopi]